MSDPVLVSLFRHKAWCNRRLIEALRAAPANVDPAGMALVLFTLDHTGVVDRLFKARLTGAEPAETGVVSPRMPEVNALGEALAETDAWYEAYVADVDPAELDEVVEFTFVADGDPGRMTKAEILAHVVTHGASHRGAIGKMLQDLKAGGAPDMVTSFISGRG